jgi:CheY-like chemotaxis protein
MKRVLVVDDEDAIRLMLTDVFEAYGYEVTTAANGREALEEVKRQTRGTGAPGRTSRLW